MTKSILKSLFNALLFVTAFLSVTSAFAGVGASVTIPSGDPASIYPGQITNLEITLSNNNTVSAINSVAFSNTLPGTLPNGLKVAGAPIYQCTNPATGTTSAGSGTLTAVLNSQNISLSAGVIPARASSTDGACVITIPVTTGSTDGSSATYTYDILAGAVTGNDGSAVANIGNVSQSVNNLASSVPTISKTFGSSNLTLGGAATTLTITVTNPNSTISIPNFSITDNFPQLSADGIIQVANPVVSSSTCTGAGIAPTFTPVANAISVSATGGTVAPSGSCTMTVSVVAKQTAGVYQTAIQTNTINGTTNFSNALGLIPANATASIRTTSPLGITKSFSTAALANGQTGTFSVVLSNSGSSPITVNSFTDSPIDGIGNAGYGLKTTGVPAVSCTGGGVAGTFARTAGDYGIVLTGNTTIAAGGTCTVTTSFVATNQTANTPITYTNTIPQGAVGTLTAGIVSQPASASILVADELRVLKSALPANPAPGNPVRYTVTIQNWSTSVIGNLITNDVLTNGQTFLTGTIGTNNFTPTLSGAGCAGLTVNSVLGANAANLTIGTMPARINATTPGSCDLTFWAQTPTGAVNGAAITNVINAGNVCYNAGATCNGGASNSTSTPVAAPVFSATKAFSPAGPLPEGTITRMTITLSNLSSNPISGLTISDTLPVAASGGGQLRVATPANAASTCGSPTITATANSTSVSLNGGTVPARASSGTGAAGTCILQVDVIGPAGVYNNTASAAGTQTFSNGTTAAIAAFNTNTAALTYTSSLSATKTFSPSSVSSGGKSTVLVRLSNSGSVPLTGLALTDPLPTGMVLANPVNAYTTCAGSASFTGAAGASSLAMTGAEMSANGTCDVLFDVIATGAASWVNTIPAGNITANGGVANQTAVAGTLTFAPPIGLSITKATNPSTLSFPGQVSRLTITVTNGTSAVTNMSFTDYFTDNGTLGGTANGMRIAATPAASTDCTGGSVSATADGTSVSVSDVSMAANASCDISVNVSSVVLGGITNTIPISAITTDQGLSNAGIATTSLTTQGNIGVTKQFTPTIISPNERSRLRLTLYNPTAQTAVSVGVTDNLPPGVTVPAGANPVTNCTGASISTPTSDQVIVNSANLPAAVSGVASTCYAEIDVTSSAEGSYLNTIPASTMTGTIGGVTATNSQPATATLYVKAPLIVHKAIGGNTLDTGNPAGFTTGTATRSIGATAPLVISIQNLNSTPITGLALTDVLPTGLVVAQTPAASTTCTGATVNAPQSATSIGLTGGTIPASSTCTMTVQVLSNIAGSYTNTIPASAITTFEGVTNDEPTQARIIISSPPVVTKEFSPAVISAGGTSTMTIYLGNDNDSAMTLSSIFTDTLPTAPGNVVVAATPAIGGTCTIGSVTAVAGAGTVSYANGASIPAGGCTITVNVTASTTGVHTNNIPAGRLQTNLGNNQTAANATLTVSPLGYISGRVFRDNNVTPNGTFQSGTDTAIFGSTIELRSGVDCTGALVDTQTSDAAGNYLFSALAAGTYSVCQTGQPSSTVNGTTTAGTITSVAGSTGTVGTASNPTSTTSQIVGIVLNGDGASSEISGSQNNNFPEIVLSSISGRVFLDQNNNGLQNGADTGINAVTIQLLDSGGAVLTTTTTDANGDYSFTNLQPGTYSVREPNQPTNTNNGITVAGTVGNGGTDGTPTAVGVTPSRISTIILPPNTAANDNNFAEILNGKTISGKVFVDYNNNGLLNGSDFGLVGVTINLTGTDVNGAPVTATTATTTGGVYSFTGLPAGTYTVSQPAQPTGTTNGISTAGIVGGASSGTASNPTATTSQVLNINLTSASNTLSAGNDFAEIPTSVPDLTIAKTHAPTNFASNTSSGTFTLTPSNIGGAATTGVITVTDTLPAGLTLASVPTGTGWSCTGSVGASTFSCTSNTVIVSSGTGNPISFRVTVASGLTGQILTNAAVISGGGEPAGFDANNQATDTIAISATGAVSGTVWRDINHDRVLDAGEDRVSGWTVELLFNGILIDTTTSIANGTYSFTNIAPGTGYEVRFREPTGNVLFGNAVTNERGNAPIPNTRDTPLANDGTGIPSNPGGADTTVTTGTIKNLTIFAGDNVIEQSLPLDPAGIVYDSVTRQPVAGAIVTISATGLTSADIVGGQLSVTTGADGFYQFLLVPTAPIGVYTLSVIAPSGYVNAESTAIPSCTNASFDGANVPAPTLIQTSAFAPVLTAPIHNPATCAGNAAGFGVGDQASTQYYFRFNIDATTDADIVNNHIPLDPIGAGDIVVSKTTPIVNTHIGQLVPYTITMRNTSTNNFTGIDVRDVLPAGFKYKVGSSSIDGIASEPTVSGRTLTWASQNLGIGITKTYKLILVVGSGVQPGEYTNTAQAFSGTVPVSNLATATVRIIPDPVFDCSDIIGKVFDDKNANGYHDEGETGVPNVRLATVNGLLVTTDADGRFHVACAAVPDADRGSNFLMKLDERTLPSGYRLTTENPRDVRVTRGKMTKLNFGVSIHRVVRIDIQDSAFMDGTADLNQQWMAELKNLPNHLKSAPSVVRVSYLAGNIEPKLARERIKTVTQMIKEEWQDKSCCHEIQIEEELVMKSTQTKRGAK